MNFIVKIVSVAYLSVSASALSVAVGVCIAYISPIATSRQRFNEGRGFYRSRHCLQRKNSFCILNERDGDDNVNGNGNTHYYELRSEGFFVAIRMLTSETTNWLLQGRKRRRIPSRTELQPEEKENENWYELHRQKVEREKLQAIVDNAITIIQNSHLSDGRPMESERGDGSLLIPQTLRNDLSNSSYLESDTEISIGPEINITTRGRETTANGTHAQACQMNDLNESENSTIHNHECNPTFSKDDAVLDADELQPTSKLNYVNNRPSLSSRKNTISISAKAISDMETYLIRAVVTTKDQEEQRRLLAYLRAWKVKLEVDDRIDLLNDILTDNWNLKQDSLREEMSTVQSDSG